MARGIFYVAVLALVIAFVAAAVLVILNWSGRVAWTVAGVLIALLVSIIAQLAPEEQSETSSVLLVYDQSTGLLLARGRGPENLLYAYAEMNYWAAGWRLLPPFVREPQDRTEANLRRDARDLLEVWLINRVARSSASGVKTAGGADSMGVPRLRETYVDAIRPPDPVYIGLRRLFRAVPDNRLAAGFSPALSPGDDRLFPPLAPKGTELKVVTEGNSRELRFRKRLFFELSISIIPTRIDQAFPQGYLPVAGERPLGFTFKIVTRRRFMRITALNHKTNVIKVWSRSLVDRLMNELPG